VLTEAMRPEAAGSTWAPLAAAPKSTR